MVTTFLKGHGDNFGKILFNFFHCIKWLSHIILMINQNLSVCLSYIKQDTEFTNIFYVTRIISSSFFLFTMVQYTGKSYFQADFFLFTLLFRAHIYSLQHSFIFINQEISNCKHELVYMTKKNCELAYTSLEETQILFWPLKIPHWSIGSIKNEKKMLTRIVVMPI